MKKNDTDNASPSIEDQLSDEQIQNIEAAGIDTISTYTDALFPDGSNMSEWEKAHDSGYVYVFNLRANLDPNKKQLFINSMTHAGFLLTYRIGYPNFPGQYGLAYVFGSKSFANPSTSAYEGHPYVICQEPLYGLDCSGMIYQMAKASGANLREGGTTDYVKTDVWNKAFNNTDFEGLQMRDTGALDPSEIEAGDIIVASSNHIGFVFDNGNSLEVFNSLGRATYSCAKNSDLFHGPVITPNLSSWLKETFKSGYHVLRTIQNAENLTVVPATAVWLASSVNVKAGDKLDITATGLWAHGVTTHYGPDGTNSLAGAGSWLPSANLGALIGRIDNNTPFLVGSSTSMVAQQNGILQFMMNDGIGRSDDNEGEVTVKVIVN